MRTGARWYIVQCIACTHSAGSVVEHGFTAGALWVLIQRAQNGELTTTKGNTACLLAVLADHVPHSTDPRFDVAERVY